MEKVSVKVLSKNVKRILKEFKENKTVNYLDIEEDYDFLTREEKSELWVLLAWAIKQDDTINLK